MVAADADFGLSSKGGACPYLAKGARRGACTVKLSRKHVKACSVKRATDSRGRRAEHLSRARFVRSSMAALPWGSADSVAIVLEGQRPLDLVIFLEI